MFQNHPHPAVLLPVTPQVQYKKGHDERKAKYTSLPDPPEVVLAKTVAQQRSDVRYYNLVLPKLCFMIQVWSWLDFKI